MKYLNKIIIILVVIVLYSACENGDQEFDDFDYTTVYFPFQYPVRTLVLGDYVYDNTNDKAGKFIISTRIGGVRENKKNVNVKYRVADDIVENIEFPSGSEIKLLPRDYYTLTGEEGSDSETIITPNSFTGKIVVQLTDDFFKDPLAIANNYVIPLQIIETSADSILVGKSALDTPNRFIPADWASVPKDFTLFGVKYVNPYHGIYLHSGVATTFDALGQQIGRVHSTAAFVEQRELWKLNTYDLTSINTTNPIKQEGGSPGDYTMNIKLNEEGGIIISTGEGSAFDVNGTGEYVKDGGSWGGELRNAMFLDYDIKVGTERIQVLDTLFYRDKSVGFEQFLPTVITP
jgi:hypothetical protein